MKKFLSIFILSFFLNFLWEISQAFLYAPHYSGTIELFTVHFRASLGDVILVFIIFTLDKFIFAPLLGKEKINMKRFLAIFFSGFIIAVLIEKYALMTTRWAYNPLMPVIPFLNVGLTPILQMALIPPFIAKLLPLTRNIFCAKL